MHTAHPELLRPVKSRMFAWVIIANFINLSSDMQSACQDQSLQSRLSSFMTKDSVQIPPGYLTFVLNVLFV